MRENDATLLLARRLARLLIPAVLAVMLFGLLVWPGLASNLRFRLSTIFGYKAFNPDIAAAGDYVAAVWSEGYNSNSATKQYGRVYLKSANATDGWEARIQVFEATDTLWGREPRVVFDPTDSSTVHVVWAQASECPDCNWSFVSRTTCHLAGTDTCDPPTIVATGLDNASTPDVAVDTNGNVHVIWREGPVDEPGSIMYCRNSCGASPSDTGQTGQHPALAFSGGYLHLVWDTGSHAASTIEYERDGDPGNGSWDGSSNRTWWDGSHPSYQEPSYPAIGAGGSAVYVAWAVQNKTDPGEYALAFDFSSDNGENWVDDVLNLPDFGRSIPENERAAFATTWRAASEPADELYSLQPDVVVTGTGTAAYAHLVWHGQQAEGKYNVWYSYLEGYDAARAWQTPKMVDDSTSDNEGLPALAVGVALTETHVALVDDAVASYFGRINVWYVGVNDNRDNDDNTREGAFWFPRIMKDSQ